MPILCLNTHSGDQITALPDKLFFGTHREVDGEGDRATAGGETQTTSSSREFFPEALSGFFLIRDIRRKNYRDTEYLRKKLLGYRILKSSFRDTGYSGYSQKIVTYQMFDEKLSWFTKYMSLSVFSLMIRYN